jgi:YD repeat-containing protein
MGKRYIHGSGKNDLKKVFTHYNMENSESTIYKGYLVNKKYDMYSTCQWGYPIAQAQFDAFDLMGNNTYRKWVYADTVRTLTYNDDGRGYVVERKIYNYDNPLHAQPTKITNNTSDGRIKTIFNIYPDDYPKGSVDWIDTMKNRNINYNPIEQYSAVGTSNMMTTGGQLMTYKPGKIGAVVPDNVKILEITSPLNSFTVSNVTSGVLNKDSHYGTDPEVVYDLYDEYNNISQYTPKGSSPISVIWGYNHTYPIARLENIQYSSIGTAPLGYINQLENYTDVSSLETRNNLKTINDSIRANLPDNVFITTYTYDPLIGITSQTSPNGVTTFYEYDSFGRLKLIRDDDDKILKTYEYHYKE